MNATSRKWFGVVLFVLCSGTALANEVYELQSDVNFESKGQNIWKPTESDDLLQDEAFDRVEEQLFKVEILDLQTPEIGSPDYNGLDALNTYSFQYDEATRVKDVDLACDDEAGEYLWLDGCYTCPNGGAVDLVLSGFAGEPVCLDYKDATAVATPSIDGCPAGHARDLFRNICYELCDSGYSYNSANGKCEENLVAPEVKSKRCADGTLNLGQCKSCPSGYSLNSLGVCTRATSKTKMSYCGKRYWDSCDKRVLGICVGGWDYSTNCNSAYIRRSNNYYDCPNGYSHDWTVAYNKTGICYKNYSNKTATIESPPSCPSGSVDTVLGCVSCPSDAPYNSATQQCGGRTETPDRANPVAWGCSTGTFDLDAGSSGGTVGQCLSCSGDYEYNSRLGRDNCKNTVDGDFSGAPSPDLSCPSGTFYDFVDGSAGCFACPDEMDRTLLPIDSPAACFGLAEGGSGEGTVDLGIQIDSEFALRFAISGDIVLDGGSVDVNLDAKPKLSVSRIDETDSYQVTTGLDEAFTQMDMASTWPTMDGYIDTHTESYSYLSTTFGVVGFDETTGLPTNDVFTEVLIDSKSGDPDDPEAERFYNRPDVATDRRHLYHAHVGYDPAIGGYDRYTRWILPELFDLALPFDFNLDFDFSLPDFLQDVTSSLAVPAAPGVIAHLNCPSPCVQYVIAEGWVNETNLNFPVEEGFIGHWAEEITRSERGDGLSIRQELGRNPPAPFTDFDIPPPQSVDFTRLDLDLDGVVSKLTYPSTPLGVQVEFKKLGRKLLVLDGSHIDIDLAVLISAEKNLEFEPNMDFIMSFSSDVEVTDEHGTYTTDRVQMPVGEGFTFTRLDTGELDVDVKYTVSRNVFTNDTNLNALPLIEGEILSLGWDFAVPTPGLPNKWTLLTVPFELTDPMPILNVDEVKDDGVEGKARFSLGGFNEAAGGSITLPELNATPVAKCKDASALLDNSGLLNLEPNLIDDGSSDPDAEDTLTFSFVPESLSCSDYGLAGVALTVTDDKGASATCVATVDVQANDIVLGVTDPGPVEATSVDETPFDLEIEVADGCGAVSVQRMPALDVYPLGDTVVEVMATDAAGLVQAKTVTVSIVDTTPPEFSGLPLEEVVQEASGDSTHVDLVPPIAGDLFGILSIENDAPASFAFDQPTTIIWTATDNNGNTATASQSVRIQDTTKPVLSLPADITAEATGILTPVTLATATATDLFEVSISSNQAELYPNGFGIGVSEVTWIARDSSGNESSGIQKVTVEDTTAPELNLTPIEVYEANDVDSALTLREPTTSDIFPVTLTNNAPLKFPLGERVIEWTARDENGNETVLAQTIRVVDTTVPSIVAPQGLVIEANGILTNIDSLGSADASDLFLADVVNDAPGSFAIGSTTVTWTATDSSGNSSSALQVIKVQDTTAPELSLPENVTVEATGRLTPVSVGVATAIDIFDVSVSHDANLNYPNGFPVGISMVSWTATDINGNSTSGSQSITVTDETPPVLIVPETFSIEGNTLGGAVTTFVVSATDIVSGNLVPECSPASGSTLELGLNEVTCEVADESGNVASQGFGVNVVDTSAPTVEAPLSIRREATGMTTTIALGDASALDVVSGEVDVSYVGSNTFEVGVHEVVWIAEDSSGNQGIATQTVEIVDTTAPVVAAPPAQLIEASDVLSVVSLGSATAVDTVSGIIEPMPSNTGPFPLGVTTVRWTATDTYGNTGQALQMIEVRDTTSPVLVAPADVSVEANGPRSDVMIGAAVAEDIFGVSITSDAPDLFPLGVTTVNWIASDENGNGSTASQRVTVSDTTAPEVTAPSDVTVVASGLYTNAELGDASATDVVGVVSGPNPSLAQDFLVGTTEVIWRASDSSGNSGSDTQKVVVLGSASCELSYEETKKSDRSAKSQFVIESFDDDPNQTAIWTSLFDATPGTRQLALAREETITWLPGELAISADFDFEVKTKKEKQGKGKNKAHIEYSEIKLKADVRGRNQDDDDNDDDDDKKSKKEKKDKSNKKGKKDKQPKTVVPINIRAITGGLIHNDDLQLEEIAGAQLVMDGVVYSGTLRKLKLKRDKDGEPSKVEITFLPESFVEVETKGSVAEVELAVPGTTVVINAGAEFKGKAEKKKLSQIAEMRKQKKASPLVVLENNSSVTALHREGACVVNVNQIN